MSRNRRMQIFIAMKFQTLKNAKFYSIEIKWFYSIITHSLHCTCTCMLMSVQLSGMLKLFILNRHQLFPRIRGSSAIF